MLEYESRSIIWVEGADSSTICSRYNFVYCVVLTGLEKCCEDVIVDSYQTSPYWATARFRKQHFEHSTLCDIHVVHYLQWYLSTSASSSPSDDCPAQICETARRPCYDIVQDSNHSPIATPSPYSSSCNSFIPFKRQSRFPAPS